MAGVFAACCNCDTQGADEFVAVPSTVEAPNRGLIIEDRRESRPTTKPREVSRESPSKQGDDENADDRKKQVQQVVKSFIKAAVVGIECTLLDSVRGEDSSSLLLSSKTSSGSAVSHTECKRSTAKYITDRHCKRLSVLVEGLVVYNALMKNVKDCYAEEDFASLDGPTDPRVTGIIQHLNSEERERMVVIEYVDEKDADSTPTSSTSKTISLLLPTAADRELFLVAMSVLQLYANQV